MMKSISIEIDSEVYEYLKRHIKDFTDTPNTVLRKLLIGEQLPAVNDGENFKKQIHIPDHLPAAIMQTLQVVQLVKGAGYSRKDATKLVARRNAVAPQTVQDKYCRQLGLSTSEFDRLINEPDQLKMRLISYYGKHEESINSVLEKLYE